MVKCKTGVQFAGFTHGLVRILEVLVRMADDFEVPLIITAGSDGKHMKGSRHYSFEAVDIRSQNMGRNQKLFFKEIVEQKLGDSFTVLLENEGSVNEHFHIQVRKGKSFP